MLYIGYLRSNLNWCFPNQFRIFRAEDQRLDNIYNEIVAFMDQADTQFSHLAHLLEDFD